MLAEINEIRMMRRKHGLTQSQLAKLSGVSQSFVAKLEAGAIEPSYSNFRKLHDVLTGISEKNEAKAEQLMSSKVISASRESRLSEAIRKMKQHGISQLPVVESGNPVGMVAEASVIESIHQGKDIRKLNVGDAMEEAPPTVPVKTPARIVTELLRISPMVAVTDKGKLKGVITKADVLNRLAMTKA